MNIHRYQLRGISHWIGLAICITLIALLIWWCLDFVRIWSSQEFTIQLVDRGVIIIKHSDSMQKYFNKIGQQGIVVAGHQFHWRPKLARFPRNTTGVFIPLWIPALLLAVLTTVLFWHNLRKTSPENCKNCGYNLTGLPEPRCPECGLPFDRIADEG